MLRIRQVRDAAEQQLVTDEAVGVLRNRNGRGGVAELARPRADDVNAEGLRIALLVSQRGKRDAVLGDPTRRSDLRCRVVEEVGRKILGAAGVVVQRVAL